MSVTTISDLVTQTGGVDAVAERCGVSHWAVRKWLSEGVAPAKHWSRLVDIAQSDGVPGVTFEWLAGLGKSAA